MRAGHAGLYPPLRRRAALLANLLGRGAVPGGVARIQRERLSAHPLLPGPQRSPEPSNAASRVRGDVCGPLFHSLQGALSAGPHPEKKIAITLLLPRACVRAHGRSTRTWRPCTGRCTAWRGGAGPRWPRCGHGRSTSTARCDATTHCSVDEWLGQCLRAAVSPPGRQQGRAAAFAATLTSLTLRYRSQ